MSAQDNLNGEQFMDVYHSTDPTAAKSIMKRGFDTEGDDPFVGTHPDSPYMAEFGEARIHLRVPADMTKPDPSEDMERQYFKDSGSSKTMAPDEHHYSIPIGKVNKYIVGATGLDAWDK